MGDGLDNRCCLVRAEMHALSVVHPEILLCLTYVCFDSCLLLSLLLLVSAVCTEVQG